ncbi:ABC transporter permease [Aquirufa rosea]|uniref:Gliding motility-associated ABC transporter permease subunit GldF n=1 Tax=Aquirufa rosea TaxID=2509241 RepID=A0A4Q1C1W6_9BACT|nr:ABC transporter permease [Aquirufa rosea]RXK52137.1 gliding motility-associated ABC transporter permease subunit GldF [Aquirufa rosea]
MWAIVQKEYQAFFSSLIGMGLMVAFYLLTGLYTWVFEGNVLDFGFAELSVFFDLAPWFFLFFIPALSMRLFSEEYALKTFDLLRSLPVSGLDIILGKVLGTFAVVLTSLIPTLFFVYSISRLGSPVANYDSTLVTGGYISLALLGLAFVCLSALASSLTNKQTLAFVLGVVFNFIFWQGPQELALIPVFATWDIDLFSLNFHYRNISKGVLGIADIAFFVGFNLIAIGLLGYQLKLKFI